MYIDSHCHLQSLDLDLFGGKIDNLIQDIHEQNIERLLCVSITSDDFSEISTLSESFDFIDISVGSHPNEVNDEISHQKLLALAEHPKVVAIGETGLDYYRDNTPVQLQQQRFITHIDVAKQVNKPLIIHTREARIDTIDMLKSHQADMVQGVMHCFTETYEMATQAIELGFYISFSGIITFKNAKELQETVAALPLERMLIETDSPYLAPVPHRGKPNNPSYVPLVAEKIAELKNLSVEEVARVTTENYYKLFHRK